MVGALRSGCRCVPHPRHARRRPLQVSELSTQHQLLSELEGSGVSSELRADLRRLHLLTRQIKDRPIDDAIDFLEKVRPQSAKGG